MIAIRGVDDWEWVLEGRDPTPDLLSRSRSVVVEIISDVNSEDIQFWKAKGTFDEDRAVPGLRYKWTFVISRGPRRIKDAVKSLIQVLREIEGKGGSPREMLAEAERRFDRVPILTTGYPSTGGICFPRTTVLPCGSG
ncbi:MAG: hypothetical protein OXQ32_06805 [bacterium]|nr:hypothetical protein [bacterium]